MLKVDAKKWWHNATVYQVYLRSFKDSNGDGIGDLVGLREELGYIARLGCDALWINPCYKSPQRDHGYDISDYRSIDPVYGSTSDFCSLIEDAHDLGLKVVMDIVPNHCSSEHPWFKAALENATGARERFIFREGSGGCGNQAPNSWQSVFGGSAWSQVDDGQWYLHAFDPEQPDFNWRNPVVREEFESILRYWFSLGVDGFRIDVAHGLVKLENIPRRGPDVPLKTDGMWDQPEVHDIYKRWRNVANEFEGGKYFVGEIWVQDPEKLSRYVGPNELDQAFAFDLLVQPWRAHLLRNAIEKGLRATPNNMPAWTLANHDVHRAVTRYGQVQSNEEPDSEDMLGAARRHEPVDIEVGTKRAKAAMGLALALPGTFYLYQGEELGLPEVLDIPDDRRQDPIFFRSGGSEYGRDGCRVPLPWETEGESFGFSPTASAQPWLPQPSNFGDFSRALQMKDPSSFLKLQQRMLNLRRLYRLGINHVDWIDEVPDGVFAFDNGAFVCLVNTNDDPVSLETLEIGNLVLSTDTEPQQTKVLSGNTTCWFQRS